MQRSSNGIKNVRGRCLDCDFLYHNDKSIPFGMLFLYKMNSLARWCSSRPWGLCFAKLPPKALLRKLLCSQSRHLTAYDALLHRLTTKGRSRSQKRRPKHVPRTFYFLQPMLVLILWLNFSNKKQSHMRSIGDGARVAKKARKHLF